MFEKQTDRVTFVSAIRDGITTFRSFGGKSPHEKQAYGTFWVKVYSYRSI